MLNRDTKEVKKVHKHGIKKMLDRKLKKSTKFKSLRREEPGNIAILGLPPPFRIGIIRPSIL